MTKQIDLSNLVFSIIVVRPKKPFFEWLGPVLARQGFTIDQVYFPQQDGVWIIPAIGTFNDTPSFNCYVNNLKPIIARNEMGNFGPEIDDIPELITPEYCDSLFEFEIRDGAQIAP